MRLRFDSILKEEKVDSPEWVGISECKKVGAPNQQSRQYRKGAVEAKCKKEPMQSSNQDDERPLFNALD